MRLTCIKLSGFKSFADPVALALPGQLVGVVGPNGCGKSNIMDAVRWVLGESRASELRGESMQDVIFNGTTSRKSASRASVELVFDNASARAGGQWGQYAEIAVRRVLTRDGASSYFINNQSVRRRDVQDVFLGTGLGPRAYAIIGQGTISRIIESRPEDLRLFLEEAAGVSKYKERRRETENRLHDTRENLTRVEDILRELGSNLHRLEAQAEVAGKYHALQAQGTLRLHQLWFLKRADAARDRDRLAADVEKARAALQERMADVRHVQAALEALRQSHDEATEQLNAAQARLYEASAEVGKLEAEIRFVVENRQRAEQRLAQLAAQAGQWQSRKIEAESEAHTLSAQEEALAAQAEMLDAQVHEHAAQLPALQDALVAARQSADAQRAQVAQVQQQIQVLAAEQRSIDEQRRAHQQRRDRLHTDRGALGAPEDAHLAQMQAQLNEAAAALEVAQEQLAQLQDNAPQLDDQRRAAQQALTAQTARQADVAARLQALRALQEKVKTSAKLAPWLARHGLDAMQRLWTRLHVQAGWETAIEAALRERMGALEVGRLPTVAAFAADAPPAKLSFYAAPAATPQAPDARDAALPPLAAMLRVADAGLRALLADWLHGCYHAATLDEALAARAQLQAGQAIYVPQGHAVTLHSVDFYAPDSEQAGLLARAQEIEQLEEQERGQQAALEDSQRALARAERAWADASAQLDSVRRKAADAQAQHHALQVDVLRTTQQAEQARARSLQLDADLQETDAALRALDERSATAQARFEELDLQLADTQEAHAQLDGLVIDAERALTQAHEQQRGLERDAQEAAFARRSLQARAAELERTVSTALQQAQTLAAEQQQAQADLQAISAEAAQHGLQDALSLKMEREKALAAQRSACDDLSAQLRANDERRMQLERELEPLRQRITDVQLKEQAAHIGLEQLELSLCEAQVDEAALVQSIRDEGIKLAGLQGDIERISQDIAALGAVNLAAMDELSSARERKGFLDAQSADLNDAITTLEDAIRKIDAETRELLGNTFETVNAHFGRMFPELFGGGQARLIMTGGEILDAGVQVMAQPPGKKNQTIHLLSGGEKALTAIALVFAIFQLNPAPFCLLDEVDAPLDDTNTERYSKLVTHMSEQTQFLFISHNKITMEMAHQLVGVTMQEQGVSRIVAVDMQSALDMAQNPNAALS